MTESIEAIKILDMNEIIHKIGPLKNRTPLFERCYPMNLLTVLLGFEAEPEDDLTDDDIWDINIREFRKRIMRLTDREQRVIEMRFHLGMTLDECAAVVGVTRERIRQIQNKACKKLREHLNDDRYVYISRNEYLALKSQIEHWKNVCEKLGAEEKVEELSTFEDISGVSIYELELSVRSTNCLLRADLKTIGDLIKFDQAQMEKDTPYAYHTWMQIRNLGKKSLKEIKQKIFEYCGYQIQIGDE